MTYLFLSLSFKYEKMNTERSESVGDKYQKMNTERNYMWGIEERRE